MSEFKNYKYNELRKFFIKKYIYNFIKINIPENCEFE
jgi:hypothetical protein